MVDNDDGLFTPAAVARWMAGWVQENGWLYQEDAAARIMHNFGQWAVYQNRNGNWALTEEVLKAFNKLTAETVVWDKSNRAWRMRRPEDKPGRQQD